MKIEYVIITFNKQQQQQQQQQHQKFSQLLQKQH